MRYLCTEIEKLVSKLEKKEDVYIFDTPENEEIYNLMWKKQGELHRQKNIDYQLKWGKNRIFLLIALFGRATDFQNNSIVLDACSGLGRLSVAALERRAKFVISYDGSFSGLQSTAERIKTRHAPENYNEKGGMWMQDSDTRPSSLHSRFMYEPLIKLKDIENLGKRHISIQGDMNNIRDLFDEADLKVDYIVHNMALHHTKNPIKTLSNLHHILRPGGCIVFSFFRENTTPKITYDLRKHFLQFPAQLIFDAIEIIEKLEHKNYNSIFHALQKEKYLPILKTLLFLSDNYSFEKIAAALHFEDLQTPHLHNLNYNQVKDYVKNNLGMEIKHEINVKPSDSLFPGTGLEPGIICAEKRLR